VILLSLYTSECLTIIVLKTYIALCMPIYFYLCHHLIHFL